MNENKEQQRVTTTVDPELWKDVGLIAIKKGITRKEIIDTALRQYRKENKKG